MTKETEFNPDDPAFLASRALDEELSEEERQRLDHALRQSVSLRHEANDLRRVDELLRAWRAARIDLDWETHATLIEARLAEDLDEQGLQRTDEWLRQWGEQAPAVDEERFVERVMGRIAPTDRGRSRQPLLFRLGVPLAAAAVVALVAFAGFRSLLPRQAVLIVSIGPAAARSVEQSGEKRVALAVFDRTPRMAAMRSEEGSLSFIAMGASPELFAEESPPL